MKLAIRDAARLLDVDEDTVYEWVKKGELPSTVINDQYRLNSTDLFEWARAKGHRLSAKALEPVSSDLPNLADALELGGLHRYQGKPEREGVLAAIVEGLPVDAAERPLLLDLVTAREFIGSTGIGEGIAIPHVRMPLVVPGAPGTMALWFLDQKVDFLSPDGKAIDTVFFLATSSPRAHLHLLGRLASALHDEGFRQAVKRRADLAQVLAEARRVEEKLSRR